MQNKPTQRLKAKCIQMEAGEQLYFILVGKGQKRIFQICSNASKFTAQMIEVKPPFDEILLNALA